MFDESFYCQICNVLHYYILFDDNDYPKPDYIKSFHYNYIINPHCYNPIRVCYDCLVEKIYTCDTELKYKVLQELIYKTSIKKIQTWWIDRLYNIDDKFGKHFIHKNISDHSRSFFNLL